MESHAKRLFRDAVANLQREGGVHDRFTAASNMDGSRVPGRARIEGTPAVRADANPVARLDSADDMVNRIAGARLAENAARRDKPAIRKKEQW
ncbi:MAG: hypothetical protein GDA53_04090 [Rhodobacteraceae bacterium]|nr:hypothetical protein [Paracoccaceae bacterium]